MPSADFSRINILQALAACTFTHHDCGLKDVAHCDMTPPLRYAMMSDVVAIARLRTLAESSSERLFVKEMLFWQYNVLPESRGDRVT